MVVAVEVVVDIAELIDKTRDLNKKFKKSFSKQDRMMDLMEEVGELSQAMLIVDGKKLTNDPKKQKTRKDIADALCDVLYDLVLLTDDYEIDLGKEYKQMLERLEKRIDKGEFS
ncbi:hypothetical protein ACFL1M_04505 [Patescibacteria group bacterium]